MTESNEKSERQAADEPDTLETLVDEPESNRFQLWLLAAAFLTTVVFLIAVNSSRSWDPYVCESEEACRGTKECIDNYCHNPEVYQRLQSQSTAE